VTSAADDEDPDALNALGCALFARGEVATAIALQTHALRHAPDHAAARADLAAARVAIVSAAAAASLYATALRREPDVGVHHHAVGSTQPFVGMERVGHMLDAAVAADPSFAPAHAALGNIAARAGDRSGAMRAYALAVMLDWEFAAAHLALAQLYDTAGRTRDAARHLDAALARATFYPAAAPYAARRVLTLKAPGMFLANALLEFCIDANRTNLDALYLSATVTALPPLDDYAAVVNAMAATEEHADAIDRAVALLDAAGVRAINDPRHLVRVRRARLPDTLRDVPGCVVPPVARLTREETRAAGDAGSFGEALPFPVLIRPVDAQRGDGLVALASAAEVAGYLARFGAAAFTVTPFVDYRSPDGFYRKYRVYVVDGVAYPYHLAISTDWLVHYWRVSETMRATDWMRAEEERFLADPASVFPTWQATFGALAAAVGLEAFGVDCTCDDAGRVLVFECDPSAFIHAHDHVDGPFAYKLRYVPRIFAALDELLTRW